MPHPTAINAPRGGIRAKLDRTRDLCLSSFPFFVEHVLWPGEFGSTTICEWHRQRLRELEDSVVNKAPRTLDLWFRGGFKTTFASRYLNMWRYLRDPGITILIRHGDMGKAEGVVGGMRQHHLHNRIFRRLFPEFCPSSGGKWGTKNEFNLPNSTNYSPEPTIRGVGIESNLTGDHYCHIHDDDIENQTNVTTAETRFKLIRAFEDTPSLLCKQPVYAGTHSCVGTPWHAGGLWLGHVIPKLGPDSNASPARKFVVRMYPACTPKLEPFAPEILGSENLKDLLYEEGPYKFSANYLLRPVDPATAVFKTEWIRTYTFPQQKTRYDPYWLDTCRVRRCISIDLAQSTSRHADCLAYMIVDIDDLGRWYIRECFEAKIEIYSFIEKLFELHAKWDFDAVYVDAVANQNYFAKWVSKESFQRNAHLPLIPIKSGMDLRSKEQRIIACQPRWANGMCFVMEDCLSARTLIDAMENYPAVKHDDLLDAMAQLESMEGKGVKRVRGDAPVGSLDWWQKQSGGPRRHTPSRWWRASDRSPHILRIRRKYGT